MALQRKGQIPVLQENREGEVTYITFPSLAKIDFITHAIATRAGGVSEGIFASMNLSYTRGDKKEAVDENFRRMAKIMDCNVEDMVFSDQTHTTNIRVVTEEDKGKGIVRPKDYRDVDGLITREPGLVITTFFADCVPLFFVDPVKKAIGLTHSGWRGTVGKIGKATVEAMTREYGTDPKDVVAAIGPSICQDCYEVSEDVAEQFLETFGADDRLCYEKGAGKYQLNLWYANQLVMQEAGIRKENIAVTDICTCCNPAYLFSHRASHGQRGNLAAFMKIKKSI